MQPTRFVLQARDPEYGHPAFETMFVVERLEDLRTVLGIDAEVDPDVERYYRLEPDEVVAVVRRFGVAFDPEGRDTSLYKWTKRREIPYLVHGGYELVLMVDGRKQFARMGGEHYPSDGHHGEELFDRCVAQGLLHKEVEVEKFTELLRLEDGRVFEGVRNVYYTRKGEEWRIPAWKMISKASGKSGGWNEDFERLEGMLFGYEDWQNDWWIENLRKGKVKFGTLLVYLAVTETELAAIGEAGYRTLPPRTRSLKLVTSFSEEADDDEPGRLMEADGVVALVRFRTKALPFLELVSEKQERRHELPPDRVKDLNRLILDEIEVVMRRDAAAG